MKNGEYNLKKAPDDYPGKTYRLNLVPEHHIIWWKNKGDVVSKNEVIHHINGDKKDNRIENLEKLSRAEHTKKHMKEVSRKYVAIECPECEEVFEKELNQTFLQKPNTKATFCSRSCSSKYYANNDIGREEMKDKYVKRIWMKKG